MTTTSCRTCCGAGDSHVDTFGAKTTFLRRSVALTDFYVVPARAVVERISSERARSSFGAVSAAQGSSSPHSFWRLVERERFKITSGGPVSEEEREARVGFFANGEATCGKANQRIVDRWETM